MAKFDPEKVTQLMVERATGYASRETAAKELAEMTGLDFDVAKAFCSNLKPRGSAGLPKSEAIKKVSGLKKDPQLGGQFK